MNNESKEKIYFLGEKLRIRKISYKESDSLSIVSESFLQSKKKGKSILNVRDLSSKETLYTFELDYYIIAKKIFENIYRHYFCETPVEFYDETFPESRINVEENNRFTLIINPFTPNHCKGHFDNYPIVPATFMLGCILEKIFIYFNYNTIYEVEGLELYQSKAIPTGKEIIVWVSRQNFLKDILHFKCEIKDSLGIVYGTYLINLKSKA